MRVYNQRCLHSAIGYVTPADTLGGKAPGILASRDASWQKHLNGVPKIGSYKPDGRLWPAARWSLEGEPENADSR